MQLGTSLVVQWLSAPIAGGPGLIPGQGTRSHMHATTKSSHAATKSSHAATKTRSSQINKSTNIKKNKQTNPELLFKKNNKRNATDFCILIFYAATFLTLLFGVVVFSWNLFDFYI